MFDLSEVKEGGNSGKADLYIYPGIREVVIQKWKKDKTQKGDPKITLDLITVKAKEEGVDATRTFNDFNMFGGSLEYSVRKIKHILTKVVKESEITAKEDLDDFVEMLNDLSRGKSLRMKFVGEEYINANGEVKEVAKIGLPEFAEAIEEGAEYPVVSEADSKLVYDKNNKYDFKKLPADQTPEAEVATSAKDKPAW